MSDSDNECEVCEASEVIFYFDRYGQDPEWSGYPPVRWETWRDGQFVEEGAC